MEHFLVFFLLSISDLSRWQNWEIQIRLDSIPLSSCWEWISHKQQNFLSALLIPWPQHLGPALPVSEGVSLLIPGLGDQIYFQIEIFSKLYKNDDVFGLHFGILCLYANLFRIQAGKMYNFIGPLETWTRI